MTSGVLRYGEGGPAATEAALANFTGATLHGFSMACTPIELLSNDGTDTVLCTASGFFWRQYGRPYLVTNWHVMSGRNPFTGDIMMNGYVPQRLRYFGHKLIIDGALIQLVREQWTVELDEAFLEAVKTPPTVDGSVVDIWGLPLDKGAIFGKDASRAEKLRNLTCFINDHPPQRIVTNAGDDCFILGYPLANYAGLMPPVWKRGSIASDTIIGVDGRPVFLIDSAVTSSMSGSPIIRKVTTLTADNRDIGALQEFASYELIGVYAGRLQNKEMGATNLGYGWYQTLIERVIERCGKVITPSDHVPPADALWDHQRWFWTQPKGNLSYTKVELIEPRPPATALRTSDDAITLLVLGYGR